MSDNNIESVLIALRRVIRATDIHSRTLIKTTGLTAPQLLLMQTLDRRGATTVGTLAKSMTLSQATVTTILDRLEKRELVRRNKSATDKRRVEITLTAQGQTAIKDAPVPLQDSFVNQFRKLEDWEQSMILASLQKIAHMMDADDMDASPVLTIDAIDSDPFNGA